ncbi:pentapeptide repeat-containing protein [Anabaena lutea]|uniref:pentapeptide repeat-containing protein n=1 Tax=Anabaena lutea TaxID=212350 RepID=UPI001F548AE2|nr:pentapeptide repeat-containing protein [Anabaena lutea]
MANEEHLEILKQGVEVWNKWRDENQDIRPYLTGVELIDTDLTGANLREAFLMNATLWGVNLSKADLRDAYLAGASLCETEFREANLSKADLSHVDLTATDLSGATLSNANLSGSNVNFEHPKSVNFNKANLSHANLSYAELACSNFSESDLSGSNLSNSNLNHTDISNANICHANLFQSQVIATNFYNSNLTGACIKDWHINKETNLDGVICEYVFIGLENIYFNPHKTERRPINGNFAPGEFASLYKKIIENTDLILRKTPQNDNNINNQGVQFYSNSTIHTWQNLRFRSKTEIKIAEALDRAGVLFVPNSLARLNTPKGRANKEADFLICYNGKWGVLEVDGPHHTAERRVEEQERERIFKRNGIKVVERFDAERCYNNPDEVMQDFFKLIEIGYS